jgi:DNA helicase-2/ATP-dependent DNA helicase PcrA
MTTPEQIEQGIDDPERVSGQQREAARANGNFFLLSRPGSGKTRTVGIRVARLAAQPQPLRVAATSYTNVAIRQIQGTVREWGVVLDNRHFTGTIHKFLLDYVLYPFGQLLGIKQPFNLIMDDEWSGWPAVIYQGDQKKRLPVGALHYTATGAFVVHKRPKIGVTREHAETGEDAQVRNKKKEARYRGLVSSSDAMYYAQKLLTDHPELCASVAQRFDELIVDEAQDTSDVQLKCLELLHSSGKLRSLVLVGDLDQSIYSFQGARPFLCKELVDHCGLTELPLTENFRSSQAICNVTCRFCRRTEPDLAVGHNKACEIAPEIVLYDQTELRSAVHAFQGRLSSHGIAESGAVVLARQRKFRDEINGIQPVEGLHRFVISLGRLAASTREQRTIELDQLRGAERLLADMAWGDTPMLVDSDQHLTVRRALMTLIQELPDFDRTLPDWIAKAREKVKTALASLTDNPIHKPQHVLKSKASFDVIQAADVFSTQPTSLLARTVHDVKGESHEAVLLVVQPRHGQSDQAELWSAPLLGEAVEEEQEEELRIAYVALTRAERYCAVALPNNVEVDRIDAYVGVGFIQP